MTRTEALSFVSDAGSLSGLYHAAIWKLFGSWEAERTFLPAWALGDDVELHLVKRINESAATARDRSCVVITLSPSEARYLLHLLRWFFDIDDRGSECGGITGVSEETLKALIVQLEQALSTPSDPL